MAGRHATRLQCKHSPGPLLPGSWKGFDAYLSPDCLVLGGNLRLAMNLAAAGFGI